MVSVRAGTHPGTVVRGGPWIGDIGELDGVGPLHFLIFLIGGHPDPLGGHAVLVDQQREQDPMPLISWIHLPTPSHVVSRSPG